ncbi:MAG: oxidoreductase [Nitrospirae bacterium GWC2_42_7]|nr:MAG: oxidoreductase [Nitrospirae bacterium GWC2_42_7]
MNILVTGGCGYIGTKLVPELLDKGHDVTVIDIMWFGNYLPVHKRLKVIQDDTRNVDNIQLDGTDAIIHLANIANDPCGDLNAKLAWEVNALATMQLMDKAVRSKVKQFLFACSGSVYGVKDEPQVTEDLTLVPISDYNKTKMVAERVLLSYKDDMIVQSIRPATVCGYSPRMRLDVSVNMLTMQALTKGKITVFGGTQVRPNINIKDIVNVFTYFLEHGSIYTGVYNAGFENISILDIARRITEFVPAEIIVTESNDPRSYRLNSDKLLSTGFKPQFSVKDAIEEIISFYREGKLEDEEKYYNIKTMKKLTI